MKKFMVLLLITITVATLIACTPHKHTHSFSDANCTTPKTCTVCNATEGEALGHTWTDANCTTPKTCTVCAATEGEALGHTWVEANCTTPKTCTACNATEGEALGHTWANANCTTPKTCTVCNATEGDVEHTYVYGVCQLCKKTKAGLILDHTYYIVSDYDNGQSQIEAYFFSKYLTVGIADAWFTSYPDGFDPILYNGKIYHQGGVGGSPHYFSLTDTGIMIYDFRTREMFEILTVTEDGNLVTTYSKYDTPGKVWLKTLNYTKLY